MGVNSIFDFNIIDIIVRSICIFSIISLLFFFFSNLSNKFFYKILDKFFK